ncbi:MAG: hypothetical protein IPG74_13700 [Flavobacteriales bacterium]|nr:hypothetical protein [Flavobacteriales bacterium]
MRSIGCVKKVRCRDLHHADMTGGNLHLQIVRRKSGVYISASMQRIETLFGKWLWLLIVTNAAYILVFRCFITLDGPMHVLHSAVLMDAMGERTFSASGLQYDLGAIDIGLLDPIAMLLLLLFTPELVEACLAAIALLMFDLVRWPMCAHMVALFRSSLYGFSHSATASFCCWASCRSSLPLGCACGSQRVG